MPCAWTVRPRCGSPLPAHNCQETVPRKSLLCCGSMQASKPQVGGQLIFRKLQRWQNPEPNTKECMSRHPGMSSALSGSSNLTGMRMRDRGRAQGGKGVQLYTPPHQRPMPYTLSHAPTVPRKSLLCCGMLQAAGGGSVNFPKAAKVAKPRTKYVGMQALTPCKHGVCRIMKNQVGGGGPSPNPTQPPDQSDHRGENRNLKLGKSGRAILGTQNCGSQTPPPRSKDALPCAQ